MSTSTLIDIAQAKRTRRERTIEYTWRNPVLDKTYHEANDAGEQVVLRLSHDSNRKQYVAHLSVSWWQPTTSTGFTVTLWAPFDSVNYPSGCVLVTPVARYGDKSFAKFESEALEALNIADSDSVVGNLVKRIQSYNIYQ